MSKIFKKSVCLSAGALLTCLSITHPANSRAWSKNPVSLAQDYMVINDNRGNGELVIVLWLASAAMPTSPTTETARELLDKYIVLGVVHAHAAKDGTMTFDPIDQLEPRDQAGHPLTLLNTNTMPPAVVGTLAAVQAGFARTLGQLGTGVKWFAFDSGDLRACGRGQMLVPFAGETYSYDMPMPGCPQS